MSDTWTRRDKDWQRDKGAIFGRIHRTESRRTRLQQECRRKKQYRRRAHAEAAATQMHEEDGGVMTVYRCRSCGHFHVGHAELRRVATIDRYEELRGQIVIPIERLNRSRQEQAAALGRREPEELRWLRLSPSISTTPSNDCAMTHGIDPTPAPVTNTCSSDRSGGSTAKKRGQKQRGGATRRRRF